MALTMDELRGRFKFPCRVPLRDRLRLVVVGRVDVVVTTSLPGGFDDELVAVEGHAVEVPRVRDTLAKALDRWTGRSC